MDYNEYLQIDNLLASQKPKSIFPRNELLFIITHQTIELWLKMLLLEISSLKTTLLESKFYEIINHLDRCILYLELMTTQFKALRVLSPLDFAKLRPALGSASGMQSMQFKHLSLSLGLNLDLYKISNDVPDRYEQSLRIVVENYINKIMESHPFPPLLSSLEKMKLMYIESDEMRIFINKLLEFDETLIKWRKEHLYVVRRMIGNKAGTGGTTIDWLINRLDKPIFQSVWEMKDLL